MPIRSTMAGNHANAVERAAERQAEVAAANAPVKVPRAPRKTVKKKAVRNGKKA